MVPEPDKGQINPVGQIYPTWTVAMVLEPDGDQIYWAGPIGLTWPDCHDFRTQCKCLT
jgi:hypothetical protein